MERATRNSYHIESQKDNVMASLSRAETMKKLAGDADEVAIGEAKNLMGASVAYAARKIFAGMNR